MNTVLSNVALNEIFNLIWSTTFQKFWCKKERLNVVPRFLFSKAVTNPMIVVSNRLPFVLKRNEDGILERTSR